MADAENATYAQAWVQSSGNKPKAQRQPKARHWEGQWQVGSELWCNTPPKVRAAARRSLTRKPAPGQGPCQLRAGSAHSVLRTAWAAPPPASSRLGLLGLPRTGQQKHSSARGPALPLAQRPGGLDEPHSAIFAPPQVRQPCGGRFHSPRLFR